MDIVSEQSKGDSKRRTRGGTFQIAPGFSNECYRTKESGQVIHFHVLPLKKPCVMRCWLAFLDLVF